MFVPSLFDLAFLSHYFHDLQLTRVPLNVTGIYNSSQTPLSLPWNTYNYCNAPHVNDDHYMLPPIGDAKLVYATIMMRHHKVRQRRKSIELSDQIFLFIPSFLLFHQRTPDNLYPAENALNSAAGWDCTNFIQENHAAGSGKVSHEIVIPSWHPFLSRIWNGTCDAGQLTAQGLADAVKHGQVRRVVPLFLPYDASP
jgi:hypothetical protein